MNELKFTVSITPPAHSMDRWSIGLEERRPSGDYSFEVAVADTKSEAIANARAALLGALKQLEADLDYRPAPNEPTKWYGVIQRMGLVVFMTKDAAEREAKLSQCQLVELTETARKSFSKREPLRFWGRVIERHTLPTAIDTSRAIIADLVETHGGRVAEFVEVVK